MLALPPDRCRRREAEVAGFRLTMMVAAGEHETPLHTHDGAQLTLVYAGRLIEIEDGRRESLEAGELLFTPAHTTHANVLQGPRANVMLIDVDGVASLPRSRMRCLFVDVYDLPEHLREELYGGEKGVLRALAGALLSKLLRIEEERAPAPPWIECVIAMLVRDYANDLTLELLARRAGVSPYWLAHAFRQATGTTVGDYLRQVRVDAAARALRETDAPIGEIAIRCGFADQAHLTRVFRALRGTTPGQLRVTRR